jgi:glycerophosphoryl diester phosphodiesterase
MAFRVAIAEGADFIEPDLVVTKDGHLVVRHENEISQTTDVALRDEFKDRRTTRQIQGQGVSGWFTEDFTLAELKTLRCRERLPKLRPESSRFNGQESIPTYQEVIDLAKSESARLKRVIGTYPEMKHASYFAGAGLPMEGQLADILKKNDLAGIMTMVQAPRIQLVEREGGPTDVTIRYRDMVTPAGLKAVAAYANGVGPEWPMVLPTGPDGGLAPATSLVADAHAAGLAVHPWTVRAENTFLPPKLRKGTDPSAFGDVDAVYRGLLAAGVDGLFSDFPGLFAKARG